MFFTCKNFMCSNFTWEKNFAPGNGRRLFPRFPKLVRALGNNTLSLYVHLATTLYMNIVSYSEEAIQINIFLFKVSNSDSKNSVTYVQSQRH